MSTIPPQHADAISRIAERHGARRLRVFGSRLHGDAGPDSDLDLLVRLDEDRDLLDLAALKNDLERLLDCRVDVLEEEGLDPYLRDIILSEARPLMKDDRILLYHIRDAIHDILDYTAAGHEQFITHRMVQDAVLRKLMVIGEAARNLSDDLRERHPEILFSRIIAVRNIIVHDYIGVDLQQVWRIIREHIPQLRQQVETVLDELGR